MMLEIHEKRELVDLFEGYYPGADDTQAHSLARGAASLLQEKAHVLHGAAWALGSLPASIAKAMEDKKYVLVDLLGHTDEEIKILAGASTKDMECLARYLNRQGLGGLLGLPSYGCRDDINKRSEVVLLDTVASALFAYTDNHFEQPHCCKKTAYEAAHGVVNAIWPDLVILHCDPRKLGTKGSLVAYMEENYIESIYSLLAKHLSLLPSLAPAKREMYLVAKGMAPGDLDACYDTLQEYGLDYLVPGEPENAPTQQLVPMPPMAYFT